MALLSSRIINFKNLCHLVFEDADVVLSKYSKHVESFLGLVQNVLENRTCRLTVQLIVVGEHWNRKMVELAKKLRYPPLVCIGAYLEAAVYGRVKISFHFLESVRKSSTLAGNLFMTMKNFFNCTWIVSSESNLRDFLLSVLNYYCNFSW